MDFLVSLGFGVAVNLGSFVDSGESADFPGLLGVGDSVNSDRSSVSVGFSGGRGFGTSIDFGGFLGWAGSVDVGASLAFPMSVNSC
jgi:hypothetical protein